VSTQGLISQHGGVGVNEGAIERLQEGHCRIRDFRPANRGRRRFCGLDKAANPAPDESSRAKIAAGFSLASSSISMATSGAGHEHDAAGGAIDKQAEIKFALDVQAFFDEQGA